MRARLVHKISKSQPLDRQTCLLMESSDSAVSPETLETKLIHSIKNGISLSGRMEAMVTIFELTKGHKNMQCRLQSVCCVCGQHHVYNISLVTALVISAKNYSRKHFVRVLKKDSTIQRTLKLEAAITSGTATSICKREPRVVVAPQEVAVLVAYGRWKKS